MTVFEAALPDFGLDNLLKEDVIDGARKYLL
jgi:hypothetical protein